MRRQQERHLEEFEGGEVEPQRGHVTALLTTIARQEAVDALEETPENVDNFVVHTHRLHIVTCFSRYTCESIRDIYILGQGFQPIRRLYSTVH